LHSSEAVPHLEFNFDLSLFLNRPIHPPLGDIKVLLGAWRRRAGQGGRMCSEAATQIQVRVGKKFGGRIFVKKLWR
jgi:hypothetical protein